MTTARAIVGWTVLSLLFAVILPGNPLTFTFVLVFLLACPGIAISGRLGLADRAFSALLLVSGSLALDALVAGGLVTLHVYTGTRAIVILAALAIAGAIFRRPVPAVTGHTITRRRHRPASGGDALDFDRSMPVLLVRVGHYPVYHGGVCAIRSFGRAGIPVHAIVEDRLTPAAASRYLESARVWPTTGAEPAELLVEGLCRIGTELGTRALAIPTDDESAVLLAEHGDALREHFLYPDIDPVLPRRLASKENLHIMCSGYGIPQPEACFPRTFEDVVAFAAHARFPVVVKNVAPFARLHQKAVGGTTVVRDPEALIALAATFPSPRSAMFQEYIPREVAEDWIFQTYCDGNYNALVPFTGIKLRSWPPHAGVTTYARAVPNEELEALSVNFCRDIGYRGVCDLDWRFDRRDGRYKLVDFNPRPGAQFELFATEAGVDVVRAMHLDLTGRSVPPAPVVRNSIRVEHLDLPSAVAYRGRHEPVPDGLDVRGHAAPVWVASDDPLPVFVMLVRVMGPALRRAATSVFHRRSRTHAHAGPQTARDEATTDSDPGGDADSGTETETETGAKV
jgi:predicted ATP-grasp superfamily ATP-dependent carboligase